MAITQDDIQQVLNAIKAESQGVQELETVDSLNGVNSLPGVKGNELVNVPMTLLQKPATDAAATANAAAQAANMAAQTANAAASTATEAKNAANSAASTANEAAGKAQQAAAQYENTAKAAMKGASARFGRIVDSGTIRAISTVSVLDVVYIKSLKCFAGEYAAGSYCNNWNNASNGLPGADMYLDDTRSSILKDKVYICGDTLYVWSEEDGDLVAASGGGSGSGFFNVSKEWNMSTYPNLAEALYAMSGLDIADEDKPGMIITFKRTDGKWLEYRFEGTDLSSFYTASAWSRYGGGDAIKKLTITRGTATEEKLPDEQGAVTIDIPQVEVDQSVNENSTNPVSGKGVAAKINEKASTYGTALQLNEIGEGTDKAYSLPAERGRGGHQHERHVHGRRWRHCGHDEGRADARHPEQDRQGRRRGEADLHLRPDGHRDRREHRQSGRATVTVTQGANTSTLTQTIFAGSTNTVDVTKYMGVGTNTVRVRVEVGEGAEMQVAQVTWSINVVQLTLSSSFNIATAITRGQTLSIPYALSGAGTKTLRCYVDGTDTEDRSITSSTANGSFSIATTNLAHGTHTVQLVVELELSDGSTIKSNSILFAVGVREAGNNTRWCPQGSTMRTGRSSKMAKRLTSRRSSTTATRCNMLHTTPRKPRHGRTYM